MYPLSFWEYRLLEVSTGPLVSVEVEQGTAVFHRGIQRYIYRGIQDNNISNLGKCIHMYG